MSEHEYEPDRCAWYDRTGAEDKIAASCWSAAIAAVDRDGRREKHRKMRELSLGGSFDDPSEHNIIGNSINTLVAKIGKSEVMPRARASSSRRTRQERAKRLSGWMRGATQRLGVHRKARLALRDSAIYGTGALYAYRAADGRPKVDRVRVRDLGVELWEEEAGDVRTLYRVMTIDRAVARRVWRRHAEDLGKASFAFPRELERTRTGDPITVVEAWRLSTEGTVGRHVICTAEALLRDEEYDREEFPVKFHHWSDDTERFFGVGLVEAMAGEQAMVNAITEKIEESFDQGGPKILVDTASAVQTEKITNTPYEVIKYTGTTGGRPPQYITPAAISADYERHQEVLIDRCYRDHGIDRMSAQSQKPAGLNSGVALDTYTSIESERFYWQTKDYEQLVVEVGRELIRVAEEIADDESEDDKAKADMLCATKYDVRVFRFAEARLEVDRYSVDVEPVSMFSDTLSGRLGQADTMRQLGLLKSEDDMIEMLDDPNIDKWRSQEGAARHVVELQVERVLGGRRQVPDASFPLGYCLEHATRQLHLALLEQGVDDEEDPELARGISLLRVYLTDVSRLMKLAEQGQQPAPGLGAPMAAGAPPGAAGPVPGPGPGPGAPMEQLQQAQ
ncbi:MAG: hypothetical protein KC501_41040 [Myxococcales bacterium]|nr:hypothetical protein [Myxococcales bacterium]